MEGSKNERIENADIEHSKKRKQGRIDEEKKGIET